MPVLDIVYSSNNRQVHYYRETHKGKKFLFIPSMVDVSIFYETTVRKEYLKEAISCRYPVIPGRCVWLLFTGRLQKQKAPLRLVQVFYQYLKEYNYDAALIIIGDGDLKNRLNTMINELGLAGRVFILPPISQTELAEFYRASDVFLLTSNYENMPFSVLEAQSCGLPVVSTDAGEVRNVVRGGLSGIVLRDADDRQLAEAVNKILVDREIFSSLNCVESVSGYRPGNVFKPVYKLIEKHCKKDYS